jgi:hypothetical protein
MRIALLVLVSLALAGVSAARAADPENAVLQQEVKALKEMVHDLQERVKVLEARSPVPPEASASPVPPQASPVPPQVAPVPPQASQAVPQAAPIAAAPLGATSGYVSPEAALRANWSKVVQEMEQGEVARLLGTPSKRFTLNGRTVWYYYYPATGGGSVFFTDAGRVSSRQSPFGWDW